MFRFWPVRWINWKKLQNSAKLAKADPEDANRKILIAVQEADEIMKSNHNIFPLKHAKFIVFLGFQYAVRLGKLDVAESYVKELYCLQKMNVNKQHQHAALN